MRDLDLRRDSLPALRSLGVFWDLETDTFTFEVSLPEKPFTRRGVMSIVNSVYDPLGFVAPVMLEGRKILQQLVLMGERRAENKTPLAWDDPLPTVMMNRWTRWRDSRRTPAPVRSPLLPPKRIRDSNQSRTARLLRCESGCHGSRCLPPPAERSERDLDITCLRPSKSCPCYPYQHTTTGTVRSSASSPSSSKSP